VCVCARACERVPMDIVCRFLYDIGKTTVNNLDIFEL